LLTLATQMKEKTTGGVKRRKYDASFKQEVLQMISNGRPVSEVAQSLGIGENIIYRWKKKQAAATTDSSSNATTTVMEDTLALHRRIQQLEQERDILKKALAIFSRQT
jgi:transposase